jgi:hypothetical protein
LPFQKPLLSENAPTTHFKLMKNIFLDDRSHSADSFYIWIRWSVSLKRSQRSQKIAVGNGGARAHAERKRCARCGGPASPPPSTAAWGGRPKDALQLPRSSQLLRNLELCAARRGRQRRSPCFGGVIADACLGGIPTARPTREGVLRSGPPRGTPPARQVRRGGHGETPAVPAALPAAADGRRDTLSAWNWRGLAGSGGDRGACLQTDIAAAFAWSSASIWWSSGSAARSCAATAAGASRLERPAARRRRAGGERVGGVATKPTIAEAFAHCFALVRDGEARTRARARLGCAGPLVRRGAGLPEQRPLQSAVLLRLCLLPGVLVGVQGGDRVGREEAEFETSSQWLWNSDDQMRHRDEIIWKIATK